MCASLVFNYNILSNISIFSNVFYSTKPITITIGVV